MRTFVSSCLVACSFSVTHAQLCHGWKPTLQDGHETAPHPLHFAHVASPLSRLVAACIARAISDCMGDLGSYFYLVSCGVVAHASCMHHEGNPDRDTKGTGRCTPNKRLFTSPLKPPELLAPSECACKNHTPQRYAVRCLSLPSRSCDIS